MIPGMAFILVMGLLLFFIQQTHSVGALVITGALVTGILTYANTAEPWNFAVGIVCGLAAFAYSH